MRAMLWIGSVAVALAAVIGASRLWAESKEKKSAPRTRIGVINLTYVIINYDKYKEFQEEIKKYIAPYQKRDAELRAQLEEVRKQAANPSLLPTGGEERSKAAEKEELEEKAKKITSQLEEVAAKLKKSLGKKSDNQMKIIYTDITEATRSYATANGLDLVMHYNDALNQEDLLCAQNISRKLNTGAFMPVYWDERMDISLDIVTILNQKMHKK